jgi:hypothetical protein
MDTCGNAGNTSAKHTSIHLTISAGLNNTWNLQWNHYEGFPFNTYRILRGTNANNLSVIDSVSSTNNSYTDLSPPSTSNLYYQVEVKHPTGCTPTAKKGPTIKSSRSNVADTDNSTYILESDSKHAIEVQPNPYSKESHLYVQIPQSQKVHIELISLVGQRVATVLSPTKLLSGKHQFELPTSIKQGVYFLRISTKGHTHHKKVIKLAK